MVVEDAAKASASSNDPRLSALVERTLIESVEAKMSTVKKAEAAALEAATILDALRRSWNKDMSYLPKTFRTLYDAVLYGFVKTEDETVSARLADAIRSQPNSFGSLGQWETSIREALDECFGSDMLGKFVAESGIDSNRTAIVKATQRRAGIVNIHGNGMDRLLFEARCGQAVGGNLLLAGDACIASIKQAYGVAEIARTLKFPHWTSQYSTKVEMPSINTLRFSWREAAGPDELKKKMERATIWMEEAVNILHKQVAYIQPRTFTIDLWWIILPYEYEWDLKQDTLVPLSGIGRTI